MLPLLDWYNACVRMVRADNCGNGRGFTRDGTLIDIYDRIGVQTSDADPSLSFEACLGAGRGRMRCAYPAFRHH